MNSTPSKPSTTTSLPRLRLNKENVKVLTVRTSVKTGQPCSGTIHICGSTRD